MRIAIDRSVIRGLIAAAVFLVCANEAAAQGPPAPSCTISTTAVSFGNYNVFSATPTDSTGSVIFNCNAQATSIRVTLSSGVSASFSPRTLRKGSESLAYNLYLDAARTSIWGDGGGGTAQYGPTNPANNQNVTVVVYGRIPAGQDVTAGAYSDTVVATIVF